MQADYEDRSLGQGGRDEGRGTGTIGALLGDFMMHYVVGII